MYDDHYVSFELTGELALAGFFLITHWPNPDTAPVLESSAGPLRPVVDLRGDCFDDLKRTLQRVAGSDGSQRDDDDGSLLESVEAWWKEIDRRCESGTDRRPCEERSRSADPRDQATAM